MNIREININLYTANRDEGTTLSLPTWTFGIPITLKHHRSFFRIMVRSIDIPPNAWTALVGQQGYSSHSGTKNLPDGNYTVSELLTWITAQLILTCVLQKDGRILFTHPNATTFSFSTEFADALGLDGSSSIVMSTPPYEYLAPKPANAQQSRSVFLNCHLNAIDNWDAVRGKFKESRTIARLGNVANNPGEPLSLEFQSPVYSDLSDRVISFMALSLSSERFSTLTILLDWTVTLSIIEVIKPLQEAEVSEMGSVDSLSMSDLSIGDTDFDSEDSFLINAARKLKEKRERQKTIKN